MESGELLRKVRQTRDDSRYLMNFKTEVHMIIAMAITTKGSEKRLED